MLQKLTMTINFQKPLAIIARNDQMEKLKNNLMKSNNKMRSKQNKDSRMKIIQKKIIKKTLNQRQINLNLSKRECQHQHNKKKEIITKKEDIIIIISVVIHIQCNKIRMSSFITILEK